MNLLPTAVDPQLLRHLSAGEALLAQLRDIGGRLAVNLIAAALILALAIWASGWASRFVQRAIGRLHSTRRPTDPTLQTFVGSVVRFGVLAVGLVALLPQLGVQATSSISVRTATSLPPGPPFQRALANRSARVVSPWSARRCGGAGRQGRVKGLDRLVTELATADNIKVVIPNGKVFGDVILNYSTHSKRRVDVVFKVPLKADIIAVLQRLRERVESDPRVRKDPPPLIEVIDLTEAFAQAAVRVWVVRDDVSAVRTDLMLAAHLLSEDPACVLAPPRPSSAVDQSAPIPERSLFRSKARAKDPSAGRRSPRSPPKA